ncbi:MAG: thioredoxin fold domain-containing protein, partial [Saprospiraceae bacterium]
ITLANPEVQEFLQDHFVKIDIDLQLIENVEVAGYYDIKTSPKFLFLNAKGQIVAMVNGFQAPEKFIAVLEKAMEEEAAGSYIDLMSRKRVNPTPDKLQKAHPLKNVRLPDSILLKATTSHKSILINVFGTDCTKCEKLKQITYQDKKVQTIINTHFYRWIIDTAQAQDIGLFQNPKKDISPTTFIYNNKGTWLTKFEGFMPPKPFIKTLNQALTKNPLQHKGIQLLEAKVFPNPTTGLFTVAVNGRKLPLHLKIIDLDGKILVEKKQTEFNRTANLRFDLTRKKGQYIVQLAQGKSMIYKKIIVQ